MGGGRSPLLISPHVLSPAQDPIQCEPPHSTKVSILRSSHPPNGTPGHSGSGPPQPPGATKRHGATPNPSTPTKLRQSPITSNFSHSLRNFNVSASPRGHPSQFHNGVKAPAGGGWEGRQHNTPRTTVGTGDNTSLTTPRQSNTPRGQEVRGSGNGTSDLPSLMDIGGYSELLNLDGGLPPPPVGKDEWRAHTQQRMTPSSPSNSRQQQSSPHNRYQPQSPLEWDPNSVHRSYHTSVSPSSTLRSPSVPPPRSSQSLLQTSPRTTTSVHFSKRPVSSLAIRRYLDGDTSPSISVQPQNNNNAFHDGDDNPDQRWRVFQGACATPNPDPIYGPSLPALYPQSPRPPSSPSGTTMTVGPRSPPVRSHSAAAGVSTMTVRSPTKSQPHARDSSQHLRARVHVAGTQTDAPPASSVHQQGQVGVGRVTSPVHPAAPASAVRRLQVRTPHGPPNTTQSGTFASRQKGVHLRNEDTPSSVPGNDDDRMTLRSHMIPSGPEVPTRSPYETPSVRDQLQRLGERANPMQTDYLYGPSLPSRKQARDPLFSSNSTKQQFWSKSKQLILPREASATPDHFGLVTTTYQSQDPRILNVNEGQIVKAVASYQGWVLARTNEGLMGFVAPSMLQLVSGEVADSMGWKGGE